MSAPCLGIIDYGAGNLSSVCNSFAAAGHESRLVHGPADLAGLTHLVLPGVGAFGDCANALRAQGLDAALRKWILDEDRPFLGICVGYQVLFEAGEESPGVPGLGIFKGRVRRFAPAPAFKVPHMGWNAVQPVDAAAFPWRGMSGHPYFYFVHSYYPEPADASLIAARCDYGASFAAAICHGRALATQFHPEKSQALGLQLLRNFMTQGQ